MYSSGANNRQLHACGAGILDNNGDRSTTMTRHVHSKVRQGKASLGLVDSQLAGSSRVSLRRRIMNGHDPLVARPMDGAVSLDMDIGGHLRINKHLKF